MAGQLPVTVQFGEPVRIQISDSTERDVVRILSMENKLHILRVQLIKLAAKMARRELLPALDKCRTIADARREVERFDNSHAYFAQDLTRIADSLKD